MNMAPAQEVIFIWVFIKKLYFQMLSWMFIY